MHLLVPRSRSSAKVKVKCKGYISQKMAVSGAFVFHKHILFSMFYLSAAYDYEVLKIFCQIFSVINLDKPKMLPSQSFYVKTPQPPKTFCKPQMINRSLDHITAFRILRFQHKRQKKSQFSVETFLDLFPLTDSL